MYRGISRSIIETAEKINQAYVESRSADDGLHMKFTDSEMAL